MAAATVTRSLVIREPDATFASDPEAETFRPGTATPIRGLFLAGDWTDTGLPATIEGAVRSGYLAANALVSGGRQPPDSESAQNQGADAPRSPCS
jgi:zeta-carotene desaturase